MMDAARTIQVAALIVLFSVSSLPASAASWSITASADTGGMISPSGDVEVTEGGDVTFIIGDQTGYDGASLMVHHGSTNVVDPGTMFESWTNGYSFLNVVTNHAIRILTTPEPRTLVVSQLTPLGNPLPNGSNTYDFAQSITCRISTSENILNTTTSRHYCSYIGGGSSPSGNGTNTTFIIRGATTSSVSTLTWNWRLQHWLGSVATGEAGFARNDGVVTVESSWWDTNAVISIRAWPNGAESGHWKFARWQDDSSTNGCVITSNECSVPMGQPHTNIAAYFEYLPLVGTNRSLVVVSEYGRTFPPEGTYSVADGSNVECSVTNQLITVTDNVERVACHGWRGSGRVPASGMGTNTPVLKITEDSSIEWQWEREFFLSVAGCSNGFVTLPDGWYLAGSCVCITAVAHEGYAFNRWTGNVPAEHEAINPLVFTNDQARAIVASFSTSTICGTPVKWLQMHGLAIGDCNQADLVDPDGDLMQTWREYVADTDPTNNSSSFRITGIFQDSRGVRIDWKGGQNAWQYLEYRSDLASTAEQWCCVFTNAPPTSLTTNEVHNGTTNEQLFYRIRTTR